MHHDEQSQRHYDEQRKRGWAYAYFNLRTGRISIKALIAYADRECWPLGYTTGLREGLADYEDDVAQGEAIDWDFNHEHE